MNSKAGLRRGFTTGTCAQAAAKGASIMLTNGKVVDTVEVRTPGGERLKLKLVDQFVEKDFARCAVIKDSGDDPDVTNGAKIYAEVRFCDKRGVTIKGGEGVGKVTKPGLAIGPGEWAINPIPRKFIIDEVSGYLPKDKGCEVTISVPGGEDIAKRTYNPKLGIVGGISIIGTTGIVKPKSQDAYKASLALELDVLTARGHKEVVLVLGYVGEKYCKGTLGIPEDSIVKIGDHVGYMLLECAKRDIKKITLVGHIGKMIKLANGQFNTHCKFGDGRVDGMARYAKACGADKDVISEILTKTTAEAVVDTLKKYALIGVFDRIKHDIVIKAKEFVNNTTDPSLRATESILSTVIATASEARQEAISKKGLLLPPSVTHGRDRNDNLSAPSVDIRCIILSLNGELLA